MVIFSAIIALLGSIAVYFCTRWIYRRFPSPFTLPLLLGTIIIILILLVFRIPYETYYHGGKWLEMLLGPAVVALAYPLYYQLDLVKKYALAIVIPVCLGAVVGVLSGYYFAKLLGMEEAIIASIVPKSVTTPVAMDVAKALGGISPLAAVIVMIAGISGAVLSPYVFRLFRITSELAKGIAIGSASHAIGTAKALENSEREGVASSVAMIISAIVVSITAPILIFLIR